MQGASAGSAFGPWGAAIGGIGGALFGGLQKKQLSDAEQLATNWDILHNKGLKEFGGQALGGAFQGIQDFSGAVKDAMSKPVPGLSELYGGIGKAEATAGKLENYKPERIDRNLAEERANLSTIGNRASQASLPIFSQADAQRRMLEGNANLSGAQKALMGGQASRAAAAEAGKQGVALEEGARGRIAGLSQAGDQLVQSALAAALQGRVSLTQAYSQAAQLGQGAQQFFLSALQQIPGMYQKFLAEFQPSSAQYGAAAQGGKDSGFMGNLSNLAQQGAQAWTSYKNGKMSPQMSQYSPGGQYTQMGGSMTGSLRS
jgi:hypothetical protein